MTPPVTTVKSNRNHATNLDPDRLIQRTASHSSKGDHRKGTSGILHKWVNYGKRWRPRWFVLQDGVLSYYKIHGPDRIVVSQETEKGSKVIGHESLRWSRNGSLNLLHKPSGEVHLKVSSIRESKSDEKRFSINTGTKRLHLRAESQEDRAAWMEALQVMKDMFPRTPNTEVSTERLRKRLSEEGVSEAAIRDSERIMKDEYAALQDQLVLLKQKQCLLVDTLRQVEVHVLNTRNHSTKSI